MTEGVTYIPFKMDRARTITVSVTPWLAVYALFLSFTITSAHVGLTFPPARKFDLDFLDNIRTKPPCGMPKGSIKTSLVTGSTFNVTWHLSYPHRGGYRLELMDSQERTLLDLTPKNGNESFIKGNPTAQHHQVKLPQNFTCEDCTIRLLRQASEWANNYRFWSCSDVDIVPQKKFRETCGGHGRAVAGRCVCNKGFWGQRCQYEDECDSEAECGGNGKCIDLGGTALPRKQCFCNPGFHGEKCRKRNAVKLPSASQPLDLSRHTKRELSDRLNLYYKIIPAAQEEKKEIEFVLEITGTSYGAIGWRPNGFNKTCQRFPFIQESEEVRQTKNAKIQQSSSEPQPEAEAEPKSESEPESEPEGSAGDHHHHKDHAEPESTAEGAAEPESAAEPGSGGKHKKGKNISGHSHKNHHDDGAHAEPESAAAEPEAGAEPESEPEGTAEPETSAAPDSVSSASKLRNKLREHKTPAGSDVRVETSSISISRSIRPRQKRSPKSEEGKAEPEPEGEPEHAAGEPEPESGASEPEPKAESEAEPEGEPHPEAEAEAEAEPGSGKTKYHAKGSSSNPRQELIASEWAPKLNDFHAMDCIDLIMGAARGSLSRIRDYYTRDRSTPRVDTFWGGKEDITSATGWEEEGKTILIFRRRIISTDSFDHDLVGDMHVIWARGQENGEYVHSPKSGLERDNPHRPNFYAPDEIKYHGHGGQRGKTRIDFLNEQVTGRKKVTKGACEDSWAHPPGCSNQNSAKPCSYNATWQYIPDIDSVRFTIETRRADRWTGIGFSDDTFMRKSDAIIGWVQPSGSFFMMDTYMTSYNIPPLDASQDISNMTGKYSDGIVRLSFLRKVVTNDPKDISLDECRFFLFPILGGTYHAVNKRIGKHDEVPVVSAQKVCIPRTCTPVRIKKPTEIRYAFDIKLTSGFGNNWTPPTKNSEDFNRLGNRIETDLGTSLKNIPGFGRLQLNDIKRDGEGAIAKLELMVMPETELADQKRVERALKETIQTGKVGNLQLDPTYLQLQAPEVINEEDNEVIIASAFGGKRMWIVLGCVAALILLAIIQAILTIYKTSGKTSSHKGSPSSGSGMAWRDYSETNYGYDAYDEKGYGNAMPMTATSPMNYPNQANSGYHTYQASHNNGNGYNGHQPTTNMSLPRPQHQIHHTQQHHHSSRHNGNSSAMGGGNGMTERGGGGGGAGGASAANPDFYFMPSQRKYSGEVVRVYVDHNKR